MPREYIPLFMFLTGASVGLFCGVTFTLWRTKEKRKRRLYRRGYDNRGYANRGAHMVGTPPSVDDEIERRGDEWARRLTEEMSDRSADA